MDPKWITDRSGRVRPFESGQVVQAIFAAGQRLGRADAFLARELADGVVHFLRDGDDERLTEDAVRELTAKVVRELGQPALARELESAPWPPGPAAPADVGDPIERAIASGASPRRIAELASAERLRQFGLDHVYPAAQVAAHRDGLLALGGLETPLEMAGGLIDPPAEPDGWFETLEAARERYGEFVALDGPEYGLTGRPASFLSNWVRELRRALHATGLRMVINLNRTSPPKWSGVGDPGPLFAGFGSASQDELRPLRSDDLLARLADDDRVRIDWHCGESDFRPGERHRLNRAVRTAVQYSGVHFVTDHPRRPVALADGVRADRPAVLTTVGLRLDRLAGDASFGRKLSLLVRLAVDAGLARYDYLRRHGRPAVTGHFQLERSVVRLVPTGLADTDIGVGLLQVIREAIGEPPRGPKFVIDAVTGSTPELSLRDQVIVAGALQAAAGDGTAELSWPADRWPDEAELAHAAWLAWKTPGFTRLRFRRPPVTQPALTGLGE